MQINVIAMDNGFGLSRDARLVLGILQEAGHQAAFTRLAPRDWPWCGLTRLQLRARGVRWAVHLARLRMARRMNPLAGRPVYDVNIFLEHVIPEWCAAARINCLVPNQECYHLSWLPALRRLDLILCKTRAAEAIFGGLGCRTEFMSFTSPDCLDPAYPRDPLGVLHLAGRSRRKGTQPLVDLWLKHPEWPRLTLIRHPDHAQPVTAPNIRQIIGYVDEAELRRRQNAAGIHLCPSEAEGFGHHIVEALGCGAVVVTTDAPPMNELVTPERGLLAAYRASEPQLLGTRYLVDPAALEEQIDAALGLADADRQRLAAHARAWYLANDRFFRRRLVEIMADPAPRS